MVVFLGEVEPKRAIGSDPLVHQRQDAAGADSAKPDVLFSLHIPSFADDEVVEFAAEYGGSMQVLHKLQLFGCWREEFGDGLLSLDPVRWKLENF